ncbi:MAG: hypothetical protein JWR51_4627, partial [Devosia sp.]|nr:hypothetical protein [Devosia sp.]
MLGLAALSQVPITTLPSVGGVTTTAILNAVGAGTFNAVGASSAVSN